MYSVLSVGCTAMLVPRDVWARLLLPPAKRPRAPVVTSWPKSTALGGSIEKVPMTNSGAFCGRRDHATSRVADPERLAPGAGEVDSSTRAGHCRSSARVAFAEADDATMCRKPSAPTAG